MNESLRWRPLIHSRNAAIYSAAIPSRRLRFLKMAESMGRADKPFRFQQKITQHRRNQCILYANYVNPVSLPSPR